MDMLALNCEVHGGTYARNRSEVTEALPRSILFGGCFEVSVINRMYHGAKAFEVGIELLGDWLR